MTSTSAYAVFLDNISFFLLQVKALLGREETASASESENRLETMAQRYYSHADFSGGNDEDEVENCNENYDTSLHLGYNMFTS